MNKKKRYLSIARISRITYTSVRSVGISARSIRTAAVRVAETLVYIYESVMRANFSYRKQSYVAAANFFYFYIRKLLQALCFALLSLSFFFFFFVALAATVRQHIETPGTQQRQKKKKKKKKKKLL